MLVEKYCACGEQFKYSLVTEEGLKEQQKLWKHKHRGIGHYPITAVKWKRLQGEEKQKQKEKAEKLAGNLPFADGEEIR